MRQLITTTQRVAGRAARAMRRAIGAGARDGALRLLVVLCAAWGAAGGAADGGADATPDAARLWRFAWASDMHLDGSRLDYMAEAFRQLRTDWQPHFVLFTGDNNACVDDTGLRESSESGGSTVLVLPRAAAASDASAPSPTDESVGVRRQRFLSAFLARHLQLPYAIIPGDNWPQGFEVVFGPKQYSFDCGGLHFLMLAPDRHCTGSNLEGLSAFDQTTQDWIARDLDRNRHTATIVAIHEPIYPPTFLDAQPLRRIIAPRQNVIAVLQGHLHRELEYRLGKTAFLVGPSLGLPPTQALKIVDVYPDRLVFSTVAYDPAKNRFTQRDARRTIAIDEPWRGQLHAPPGVGFEPSNYDAVPARPLIDDPQLPLRFGELLQNAASFLLPAK